MLWTYEQLEGALASRIHFSESAGALLDSVNYLSHTDSLVELLESMSKDRRWLKQAARESYKHENGFDKLVICESEHSHFKLRLHIWWPDQQPAIIENIHNHRWDFASSVLSGSFRTQDFEVSDDGESMHHYIYNHPEENERYSLTYRGVTSLKCTRDEIVRAGTSYVCPRTLLHRVIGNPEELTATLMLQGNPARDWPVHVLASERLEKTDSIDALRFDSDAVGSKLRLVINHLRAP